MLIFVVIFAALLGLSAAVQKRSDAKRAERPRALSDLYQEAGGDAPGAPTRDFLARETFVFVSSSSLERRLDYSIEDAHGWLIGTALQQPRPPWLASDNGRPWRFSTVHVELVDEFGAKRLEVVRPAGLTVQPVSVIDENGSLVGSIEAEARHDRAALVDPQGGRLATTERKTGGYEVDLLGLRQLGD
jgi:hypothetical protein